MVCQLQLFVNLISQQATCQERISSYLFFTTDTLAWFENFTYSALFIATFKALVLTASFSLEICNFRIINFTSLLAASMKDDGITFERGLLGRVSVDTLVGLKYFSISYDPYSIIYHSIHLYTQDIHIWYERFPPPKSVWLEQKRFSQNWFPLQILVPLFKCKL